MVAARAGRSDKHKTESQRRRLDNVHRLERYDAARGTVTSGHGNLAWASAPE
jgi:hypothetical protein